MESHKEIVKQITVWWESYSHYSNIITRFTFKEQSRPLGTGGGGKIVKFHLYTENNIYHFSASETYMGCVSTNRRPDVGEGWSRGRDLPDGKFNKETWDNIFKAIAMHEIKAITNEIKKVGI